MVVKLLIYAPCEKAIVADDKTSSIVSIMESISVNVPKDLPADALMPIRWTVFSLWKRDQEVDGLVELEELTDVIRPDDTIAASGRSHLRVTNEHLFHRSLVHIPVFPIGLPGYVKVRCRIRQLNPETEWVDVAEFPLLVVHTEAKAVEGDNPLPEPQPPATEAPN